MDLAVEFLDDCVPNRVSFPGVVALDVIDKRFLFLVLALQRGPEVPR